MMKNIYGRIIQVVIVCSIFSTTAFSQDTLKNKIPIPIQSQVGFDVIILKNGDLVYGLVKEVGLVEIKYQRTDIPDGPVYTILRKEVYAISYRNQVKDILSKVNETIFYQDEIVVDTIIKEIHVDSTWNMESPLKPKQKTVLIGFGLIRGYTGVDNEEEYSSSVRFPTINLGIEMYKKDRLRVGIQLSIGANKFTKQEFSSYDSAQKNISLKENIFALHLYGKYNLSRSTNTIVPYILGGLGFRSSNVSSEAIFKFINNSNQTILVKSGGRSVDIGTMFRAGLDYKLNDQYKLYADAGSGPSVIQLGLVLNIDYFK